MWPVLIFAHYFLLRLIAEPVPPPQTCCRLIWCCCAIFSSCNWIYGDFQGGGGCCHIMAVFRTQSSDWHWRMFTLTQCLSVLLYPFTRISFLILTLNCWERLKLKHPLKSEVKETKYLEWGDLHACCHHLFYISASYGTQKVILTISTEHYCHMSECFSYLVFLCLVRALITVPGNNMDKANLKI